MAKNSTGNGADGDTLRAVERFLYRQAEILDDRLWDEWLALFSEGGIYWMPVTEDQETGDGVPNIFYEDINLMKVRIGRVTHPRAHSQNPPNRTSHVVGNVIIEHEDRESGEVVVRSKFHATEFYNDAIRVFAGKYLHRLKKGESGYQIQLQRVDMVNAEGPYDYVLQTWI